MKHDEIKTVPDSAQIARASSRRKPLPSTCVHEFDEHHLDITAPRTYHLDGKSTVTVPRQACHKSVALETVPPASSTVLTVSARALPMGHSSRRRRHEASITEAGRMRYMVHLPTEPHAFNACQPPSRAGRVYACLQRLPTSAMVTSTPLAWSTLWSSSRALTLRGPHSPNNLHYSHYRTMRVGPAGDAQRRLGVRVVYVFCSLPCPQAFWGIRRSFGPCSCP